MKVTLQGYVHYTFDFAPEASPESLILTFDDCVGPTYIDTVLVRYARGHSQGGK